MTPTTVGLGPFNPAIRFNHDLFVNPVDYDNEDDALEIAQVLVRAISSTVLNQMASARFNFIKD